MSRPGLPPAPPEPPPDLLRRLRLAIALCVAVVAIASVASLITADDDDRITDEEAAALALFSRLGDDDPIDEQNAKAADSEAKSTARNTVSQVESCFTETSDYAQCGKDRLETDGAGLDLDDVMIDADVATYAVEATSTTGNTFRIARSSGGGFERTCTSANDDGGCAGGTW